MEKSIFPEVKVMRKKEVRELEARVDQLEKTTGTKKLDKMSMRFVLPLVLFYFIIGLLLILLEDLVTDVAAYALAAGLVVIGGWLLIRYFRSDIDERLAGMDFAAGLILLLAGVLLILSPDDMQEVFPKIWALSLIFGCFLKIQYAFDEKTVGMNRWWIMLIFAAVSLAIGVLALLNKKVLGDNPHLVIGIFMIGEAVLDLVTYFLLQHGKKKQNEERTVQIPQTGAVPETLPQPEQAPESGLRPEQQPET